MKRGKAVAAADPHCLRAMTADLVDLVDPASVPHLVAAAANLAAVAAPARRGLAANDDPAGRWWRARRVPIMPAALCPSPRMRPSARPPSPDGRGAPAPAAPDTDHADHADHAARARRDTHLAQLLAAAAAGDAGAFEVFYEATFAYARTVARRLVREAAAVEDLLADCYFEAWRSAARFDAARGSAVTWLLVLVRSRCLDALRAAAARPDRLLADVMPSHDARDDDAPGGVFEPRAAAHGADGADGAAAADDPAERLWRKQAGAELHAALATLSAPERWVLGLAYLRELTQAEIAACTGMPLGTVKSHALRAQQKLRAALADGGLRPAGHAAAPER
jgi:RNA polymerase sigma-70 factor (ECF subfamily)